MLGSTREPRAITYREHLWLRIYLPLQIPSDEHNIVYLPTTAQSKTRIELHPAQIPHAEHHANIPICDRLWVLKAAVIREDVVWHVKMQAI